MYEGTVEKGAFRQTEVGNRVPVIEAFHVWPVFLSRGSLHIRQCGESHLALEHLRKYLTDAGLLTIDDAAIRQGDPHWRLHTSLRHISQLGAAFGQSERSAAWRIQQDR